MKKLNRKGFTLVELLAVIVILAIVVGIAIPSVTSIINGSKNSALGVAVDAAVDALQDQYDMYVLGEQTSATVVKAIIDGGDDFQTLTATQLETLGFDTENVETVMVRIVDNSALSTAKICLKVEKVKVGGDYYTTQYWNTDGSVKVDVTGGNKNQAGNTSSACN